MNSGAYAFVEPHLLRILSETNHGTLTYVGRRALAMTAVGSSELHSKESKELTDYLLSVVR